LIRIKSPREIEKMRRAGKALAEVFVELVDVIQPGIVTREIDKIVESAIRTRRGKPAFKGYRGGNDRAFPAATCISIEAEVVHGVPSHRRLLNGEIVGIDIGMELDGWFADMAASFLVGEVNLTRLKLQCATREALYCGIAQARAGGRLSDIGSAIENWVGRYGFSVVHDLVGHGIGSKLHEDPAVPNYFTRNGDVKLVPGMTLAIEPMVSAGDYRIRFLKDDWTAITIDGAPAGHFEHTVLITDNEPEILTLLEGGKDPWHIAAFNKKE